MVAFLDWLFEALRQLMEIELVGNVSIFTLVILQAVVIAVVMLMKGAMNDGE